MWLHLASFVVWALVAGSGVFWGLRLFAHAPPVPEHARAATLSAAAPALQRTDLSRLLGVEPVAAAPAVAAAPTNPRFQLIGVIAQRGSRPAGRAVALIAVDGKPARAFRIGAAVSGDMVLKAVNAKSADLGAEHGPVSVSLQLVAAAGNAATHAAVVPMPPTSPTSPFANRPLPQAARPAIVVPPPMQPMPQLPTGGIVAPPARFAPPAQIQQPSSPAAPVLMPGVPNAEESAPARRQAANPEALR